MISDLYYKCITDNNITYSVDMLRLKTYLTYSQFSEIEFRLETLYEKNIAKKYTTGTMSQFFYNYVIDVGGGHTFWFGFLHNTERRSTSDKVSYNFTIEFNPNKIRDNAILKYLLSVSYEWYIKSYDLAMDLKVSILDLIYDKSNKRKVHIFSNGYDDKTIVIGTGDCRTKIYNKKKESNLNMISELTRVEVSRCIEDFDIRYIGMFNYGGNFPIIYLNNYVYSFSDYKDKTTLAILYAIQNGYPVKDLSRSYRQKISKMLEGGYKIFFNEKIASQVVKDIIFTYFVKNPLIHFI